MNLEARSTEFLMEIVLAVDEGRYPTRSHGKEALKIALERIPSGCLMVYREIQI